MVAFKVVPPVEVFTAMVIAAEQLSLTGAIGRAPPIQVMELARQELTMPQALFEFTCTKWVPATCAVQVKGVRPVATMGPLLVPLRMVKKSVPTLLELR